VGEIFDIHPLTLENIVNATQRPKVELHDRYLYLVTKMIYIEDRSQSIHWEQISLLLFDRCVISFQERVGDVFAPIRNRLRTGSGLVRKRRCDYLVYALVDAVVDQFFSVLENLEESLEPLEIELMRDPLPEHMEQIYRHRKGLMFIRRVVWPLRELLAALDRQQPALVRKDTRWFFRDIYDHVIQVMDRIETMQAIISGLIEIYLSSISYRMNTVMKVLTVIATIFIPLTFVVGIYGMNFRYMPELSWRWGYPAVLGIMLIIVLGMLLFFKKKKWL
jgi:magnesium transporter